MIPYLYEQYALTITDTTERSTCKLTSLSETTTALLKERRKVYVIMAEDSVLYVG